MAYLEGTGGSAGLEREGKAIVESLGGAWTGRGAMCRCPAHDDRNPSLSVRLGEKRLLFHCFAGCNAREVIHALNDRGMLDRGSASRGARPEPRPRLKGHRAAALNLWSSAKPIEGSIAAAYLAGRGLEPVAGELRFHPLAPCGPARRALFLPAMLAAVRDQAGLVAIHRTFLDHRTARLAGIARPRRALGCLGNGAVRFGAPVDGVLGLAEGIESALAATRLTRIPCWATLGAERFGRVKVPADVRSLVLFLDNDRGGARAEQLARAAPQFADLAIEAEYPPRPGADWNDVLRAIA